MDPQTPADHRILELLRAGTPAAEIAVRLGMPIGEAKERVLRLRNTLDHPGTLDPPAPPPLAPPPPPQPLEPPSPLHPLGTERRRPALAIVTTFAAFAVVSLVVAAALLREGESPTPAPVAPADPGPRTPPPRVESITPALDIPDYSALVLLGCHGCDADAVTLARISRQDRGEPALEPLFTAPAPTCISSAASAPGGFDVVLALVSEGGCSGTDPFSGGHTTTFLRSSDGGVTWNSIGTIAGVRTVVLVTPEGPLIYPASPEGLRTSTAANRWAYLGPGGTLVPVSFAEGKPVGLDSSLVWTDGRNLQTAEGPIPSPRLPSGATIDHFALIPGQDRYLLSWVSLEAGSPSTFAPGGPAVTRAIVDRSTGDIVTSWVDTSRTYFVSFERLWGPMAFGVTVGDDSPRSPHVLNINARSTHRLSGHPWDEISRQGLLYQLVHVSVGPFAEVLQSPSTGCLEVRRRHSSSAPVVACVPLGVQLTWAYDTYVSLSDIPWGAVVLPDGTAAWAPLDHLQHPPVRPLP